jgi:phosphinothricin acetyltransferase
MNGLGVAVRDGEERDLDQLTEIYNHYVRTTAITFDIEPFTVEARRHDWFTTFATDGPYRLLVAEEGGEVLGYACTAPFRPKAAYVRSVTTSVYCDPAAVGRGVGTRLYGELLDAIRGRGIHRILTGITLPNAPSVRLHERFGFSTIGVEHEVGWKFDQYWDVLRVERSVDLPVSSLLGPAAT